MPERTEHDLLGTRQLPQNAYWGIHTLRARENFPFSTAPVNPRLICAMAVVKLACARANTELGYLDPEKSSAIIAACREIIDGVLVGQFPLDSLQGGAGTSINMNLNEVIANRALELIGAKKGEYDRIHPIDHVNLHQSTNDVFPTAVKIAAIGALRDLADAVAGVQGAFQRKEKEFAAVVTIGRTQLQDAVPMTLGAQFSCFAEAFGRDRWRTFKCEERLRVVNLGGTAVGTGLAAPRRYIFLVIEKLREVTALGLTRGENAVEQTANADAFAEVAGILAAHAANLIKTGNDLRLLHGMGEIRLPAVQAGSSIMPGKVNPVICETMIAAGMKVRANVALVNDAVSAGTLQINEFLPVISWALLEALDILIAADRMILPHIEGIACDPAVCRRHADSSPTLITAFLPRLGYERAQELVREFSTRPDILFRDFLEEKLGRDVVDRTLSPEKLTALGYREELNAAPVQSQPSETRVCP